MDGSIRRSLAALVLTLVACQPSPVVTQGPSTPGPTTATTASPVPTQPSASPVASPSAAPSPIAIDLPAEFAAIPWAQVDRMARIVRIGVLGKPATTTRMTTNPDDVTTSGPAVLVPVESGTEIVDAATGKTIATFDAEAWRLPLEGAPPDDLTYAYAPQGFIADVARGYLYDLGANRDGVQLRRFALDGSRETLLAVVAPDPGKEFWDKVGLAFGANGEVIATACPPESTSVTDTRCRIYRVAAGAAGPIKPRFLPAKSPRPCFLVTASPSWVIGSQYEACRADGGAPTEIPYVAIHLDTLEHLTIRAESNLHAFGAYDGEDGPVVVGNLEGRGPWPVVYPALGVIMEFWTPISPISPAFTFDGENGPLEATLEETVFALVGSGDGWSLLRGFDPAYVTCGLDAEASPDLACRSGITVLETGSDGLFVLPEGTFGEITSPFGNLGF